MNSPLSNKSQLRTSTSTRQICHPPRNLSDRVEQSATSALFPLVIGECCRKQEFKRTLTHSLCLCVTDKEYQPGKAGSLAGFYAGGISCCWDVYHVVSTVKERCRCEEGRTKKEVWSWGSFSLKDHIKSIFKWKVWELIIQQDTISPWSASFFLLSGLINHVIGPCEKEPANKQTNSKQLLIVVTGKPLSCLLYSLCAVCSQSGKIVFILQLKRPTVAWRQASLLCPTPLQPRVSNSTVESTQSTPLVFGAATLSIVCLIITLSVICMCVPLLLDIYCLFVWGWTCRSVSDSRGNKAKRNRLCPTCVIECRWTLFLISAVTVNLRLKETQSLLCIPLVAHVAPPVVCRVHWLLLSSELLNTAVVYPNLPPHLSGFTFKFKYFIKPAAFKLNNSINNQQFATFEVSCS